MLDEDFFVLFVTPDREGALEATYSLVNVALERRDTIVAVGFEHDGRLSTSNERVTKVLTPTLPQDIRHP